MAKGRWITVPAACLLVVGACRAHGLQEGGVAGSRPQGAAHAGSTGSDGGAQGFDGEGASWARTGTGPDATRLDATRLEVDTPGRAEAGRVMAKDLLSGRPAWYRSGCKLPFEHIRRIERGHYPGRSPELTIVPRYPNTFGNFINTTHSGPWDYLQRVPVVFYGPGFIRSQGDLAIDREVTLADIAPTYAKLLKTPFPGGRPGQPLNKVLVPESDRPGRPALILTIVWDGAGLNVLDAWPKAWPNLASLMGKGTNVTNATVGSSPSITPAIHTTIGTGTFPEQHGIVSIPQRDGAYIVEAFEDDAPTYLEVPTLADLYDRREKNRPRIGMFSQESWQLGMIGHGAGAPGGDADIDIMIDEGGIEMVTNPAYYYLPPYLPYMEGLDDSVRKVDLTDGKLDGRWLGRSLLADPAGLPKTPVWVLHQTKVLKTVLEQEGFGKDAIPDMFFMNYKEMDHLGHLFNMLSPEVRETIGYADDSLREIRRWLDHYVGKRKWVLTVTADHGMTPDPNVSGAWPMDPYIIEADIATHFGLSAEDLFEQEKPNGFWIDADVLAASGVTLRDIAGYLLDYELSDSAFSRSEIPRAYRDRLNEKLFAAAFPSAATDALLSCAQKLQS